MIPSIFLIPPAVGCLIATRYAAFYWDVSAELWTVFKDLTASADVVQFPIMPQRTAPPPGAQHSAEIVRFGPAER